MRSIKELRYKFLGEWVTNTSSECWDCESFFCVGESDTNIYIWYKGTNNGPVHKYQKNNNFGMFYVVDDCMDSTDDTCFYGWNEQDSFKGLEWNNYDKIKWIK